MKVEVCNAALDFPNNGVFDVDLSFTNIVLISKVSKPSQLTDFRPISLCNILYKIIGKVLANKMKKVLPFIISPTHNAFILG